VAQNCEAYLNKTLLVFTKIAYPIFKITFSLIMAFRQLLTFSVLV